MRVVPPPHLTLSESIAAAALRTYSDGTPIVQPSGWRGAQAVLRNGPR